MAEMIRAGGGDQKCVSQYANDASNFSTSASFSANVGSLLASASTTASAQASGGTASSSAYSEGCKQAIIKGSQTLDTVRQVNCAFQNSMNQLSVSVSQGASIRLEVDVDACQTKYNQSVQLISNNARMCASSAISEYAAEACRRIQADALDRIAVCPDGSIVINDSNLTVDNNMVLQIINDTELQSSNELSTAIQRGITNETTQNIENELGGSGTHAPDTLQVVNDEVKAQAESVAANIMETVSDSKVETTQDGNIVIYTNGGSITLDNAIINVTMDAEIRSAAVMKTISEQSNTLTNELLTSNTTSQTSKTVGEKFSEAIAAMGAANAAAIKAQADGHAAAIKAANMNKWLVGVAAVGVFGLMIWGGKGMGMTHPGYNARECERSKTTGSTARWDVRFGRYYEVVGALSVVFKIKLMLVIFRSIGMLLSNGLNVFNPTKWGELEVGTYLLLVVAMIIVFKLWCGYMHNSSAVNCFSFNTSSRPSMYCYNKNKDGNNAPDQTLNDQVETDPKANAAKNEEPSPSLPLAANKSIS